MKRAIQLATLLSATVFPFGSTGSTQPIITTVAGNGTADFCGDGGPATDACLSFPFGVAVDANSNLFIADTFNHRIRGVDAATGSITTVAGNGTRGFCGDGGPAIDACLGLPTQVAEDVNGNLFIADLDNNRIRGVDGTTGTITTVAGNGTMGFCGDGGPATSACLSAPFGVALDPISAGFLIADTSNNRIRLVQ